MFDLIHLDLVPQINHAQVDPAGMICARKYENDTIKRRKQ